MANEIVKVDTDSGTVELSGDVVRRTLCNNPQVTDREVQLFIELCKAQHLNPFIKEAYIIKYGQQPATMVVGKDVYTKRAQKNPKFKGYQAGITLLGTDGKLHRREGSMPLDGEQVTGGWCKVYVDGYDEPMYDEVAFTEYAGRKKDGTINGQWSSKPGTMIRKVAVVHALREAFPDDFAGLYDESEMAQAIAPEEQPEAATAPSIEVVEDNPIRDAWGKVATLKDRAIGIGIKEEGIDSWVETTFAGRDKKTLAMDEIASIADYIQGRISDMESLKAEPIEVEAEIIEDVEQPPLYDEDVPF